MTKFVVNRRLSAVVEADCALDALDLANEHPLEDWEDREVGTHPGMSSLPLAWPAPDGDA